jgi:large subunit ribosomal protein L32e
MSKQQEIRKISDLPYYKEDHAQVLEDIGIKNLDDLLDTLYDEEKSKELIDGLKGVGPKIADQWIELIEDRGVFEEEEEADEEVEIVDEEVEEETIIEEPETLIEEEGPEVVEEGGYFAAPKPELDDETRRLFEQRKAYKMPKFKRQEWFRYKKLGDKWRKPKGIHSKLRRRYKYRPPLASVGYKTPKKVRGLHASGFEEVLIHNLNQLEGIDPKTQAARVGATVGYKKRLDIEKKAAELGIHILNRMG